MFSVFIKNKNKNIQDQANADEKEDAGPLEKWSSAQVGEWIRGFGSRYHNYATEFMENGIDGNFLVHHLQSEEELEELVDNKLHRKLIWSKVKKLQKN